MEEDIKILERVCEARRFDGIYTTNEVIFEAIQNLINKNKELKKITKAVKLLETEKVPDDTFYVIAKTDFLNRNFENLLDDYIPKSKVREKIQSKRNEIFSKTLLRMEDRIKSDEEIEMLNSLEQELLQE